MENKEWFYIVRDPRRDRGKIKHSLENVLRLALIGVVCGCDTYDDFEEFVEDRLHWTLDVVFKEDSNRTRTEFGPQNLSILRKLALSIVKRADDKRSLVQRRKAPTGRQAPSPGWNGA